MPTPLKHYEEFTVRAYEIDHRKLATVPALVRLMHEAALQNVLDLGLSVWHLEPHNISWVLMRKNLHIDRLPGLGERITVMTYPSGFEKFFTYRDYRVLDKEGELIAWSSSTWLLMDTRTRRMTRMPDFILSLLEQMPPKEKCLPRPADRLPALTESSRYNLYEVQYYDLDFNNHLNNTYYLKWMLEALPDEVLERGSLKQFDISYRNECIWRDQVRSEVQQTEEGIFLHRLARQSDGLELALARSVWAFR